VGVCSGVEVGVVQGGATRMLLEVYSIKSFLFENVTKSEIDVNNNVFHIRSRLFLCDFSPVATNFHSLRALN
jgi:hypothetical protein